jgi:NAD(P)-dependent dehydrogenase (short-subunit alcohol dehydrogenase family)
MAQKIWFITGISSGLGKALAEAVMQKGEFVVGTFRQKTQAEHFSTTNEGSGWGVVMDLTNPTDIENAFNSVRAKFGRLDVLVNNAGYGLAGAVEETSEVETRAIFEANFFGALKVTQAALPIFRNQGSGQIIQISSHGGIKAFAGFGIYNASKFALEGFSEALAQEVAPLGIKLTIVQPGPFRTKFANDGFGLAEKHIEDYAATAGVFRTRIKGVDGKQEGDPAKGALAIYGLSVSENPPLRLPLGKVALGTISSKIESVQNDLNNSRAIAESTVFEG